MKENSDDTERRYHKRASVKNVVIGVLNTGEPALIGSITDISYGGVKFTYHEFRTEFKKDPIHSIDLIADSNYMLDFPCSYAWNKKVATETSLKSNLRQYGIKFGKLNAWQFSLLRSIISDCSSLGSDSVTPNVPEAER
jgi:hypothetical protein